ncbi:hypothetical protein A3K92_08175 [Thermococcus gorgonarius]|uniref:Uncharacterized protein n=1 Tax=Thermococcus gorgonarius TaxID=71997 RepID=A0A2Z2MHL3_THEGO|nr:hypothetical protein A3K92_08175 [Thermococcus gorgonarius]
MKKLSKAWFSHVLPHASAPEVVYYPGPSRGRRLANPKKLLAPIKEAEAATLWESFQSQAQPYATERMKYIRMVSSI